MKESLSTTKKEEDEDDHTEDNSESNRLCMKGVPVVAYIEEADVGGIISNDRLGLVTSHFTLTCMIIT